MAVRYDALSRSVTVFPLKTRFINTSAGILIYFVNTTLKFSAILDGKLNSTKKILGKGYVGFLFIGMSGIWEIGFQTW